MYNKNVAYNVMFICFFRVYLGHIIGEVAHDCVAALKNWFVDRGIKNLYDTWHGKLKEWMNPQWFVSLVTA